MNHPSKFISPEAMNKISAFALEAESLGRIHPEQLKAIYENGWFQMLVPRIYGGLGLSLTEVIKIEEAVSYADGSTGWVVTLCSGASWFSGFLDSSLLAEISQDDKVCYAGSGAATGKANITTDGFEIEGCWQYASGALHATVFTANCILYKDNAMLHNEDGTPVIRSFIFKREEVKIHANWKRMGMIATASNAFEVKKLTVHKNRCFIIDKDHAVIKDPVYQYPFLLLAETTLAINLSGMAMRFVDLCEPLLANKSRMIKNGYATSATRLLQDLKRNLLDVRARFYEAVETSWQEEISVKVSELVTESSLKLANQSCLTVNTLFPYCGLRAADPDEEINRVWRNINTASLHTLFNYQ